jgi:hypothetical protein
MSEPGDGAADDDLPEITDDRTGPTRYMTLAEVAVRLGVAEQEVYDLVRRGQIYGIKAQDRGWMVALANLEAYEHGRPQGQAVP